MKQPLFLETDLPLNKGADFDYLREEGIKLIQNLTGQFWTDFNEHDPGVTILEQVVYALTEIAYKAQFDIADLLHSDSEDKQSFFRPEQVLPGNALTINDYRKILFDSVFEIKNVWVFPINSNGSGLSGLYRVLIDVDQQNNAEAYEAVKGNTFKAYNAVRNICEDIGKIDIAQHIEIGLSVDIEVSGTASTEEVMAHVFYEINNFLCPEIKFYSLEELLDEGYQLNDIYNGPLLKHGFVKTEDLPAKTNRVLVSEVMKIIMQVEGVSSVKNLKFHVGEEEVDNQILLKENELPRLRPVDDKEQNNHSINIYKGETQYRTPNSEEVKRRINELKSAGRRVYRLNEKTVDTLKANAVDIESYYSIQNQFPAVYGIGEEGVSGKASKRRRAQAKQLKGYLLLFEQVIANGLSQLAHVKDLLSFNGKFQESYFTQELTSVPDISPILKNEKIDTSSNDDFQANYSVGLKKILSVGENRFDRIQRLLDYLLALHGEEYSKPLKQFNYYFDNNGMEQFMNSHKATYLQAIPFINSNRSKGYDYTENIEINTNASGLEVKVALLLGLNAFLTNDKDTFTYSKRSVFSVFDQFKIKLTEDVIDEEDDLDFISENIVNERFEIVDDEEVLLSGLNQKEREELLSRSWFSKKGFVTPQVLLDGLNIENYRLGTLTDSEKTITVVFYNQTKNQWMVLSKFRSFAKAEKFVISQIEHVRELNMSCEGVHLIEHLLLRPHNDEKSFGLYVLDEEGNRILGSEQTFSFLERIEMIDDVLPYLLDISNYSVEINTNRDFEIHFKTDQIDVSFESIVPDPSVEKTHETLKRLVRFMNSKEPSHLKFDFFVRNKEESPRIPEDFYSHRLSMVFPEWTARFMDEEYRRVAEEVITNEKPASVDVNISWLEFEKFRELEGLMFNFFDLKRNFLDNSYQDEGYLNTVDDLTNLLFEFADQLS
ncbi:hypothetical protein [Reichenbachiella versicolor]|uniref:hypothetical protein n=1 Tax=Reichenbachiella versicolor TaxID=1821036 RepID=UPI000D6E6F32|nr:hypothetical protein [Reichenbachiella versicolor]